MTATALKPSVVWRHTHTAALFSATLFVSAATMFMLQPMAGKMLLPLIGGTPAGWIVAMAFFQLVLLAGYALANFFARFSPRGHGMAFAGLLLTGSLFLPVEMTPQDGTANAWMALKLLAVSVGAPFLALSMASSTLQRLFSSTGHPAAHDPYFLFAASNLGSFAGLLLYPLVAEQILTVPEQARLWMVAYILLMTLACACISFARAPVQQQAHTREPATPLKKRLEWIALAFIPSSLMLGVTTHISTNIMAVPLVWVLPLALYLLTFVLAFSKRPLPLKKLEAAQPVLVSVTMALVFLVTVKFAASWYAVAWHMLAFGGIALLCHTKLATLRPLNDGRRLTDYYLMIAVGGALGGILNAFIAPAIFNTLAEYPLVVVLSLLVNEGIRRPYPIRHLLFCVLGAAGVMMLWAARKYLHIGFFEVRDITLTAVFALATLHPRAAITGCTLLAVIVPLWFAPEANQTSTRNFFGTVKVYDMTVTREGKPYTIRNFQHGSTLHGIQVLNDPLETEPTSYFGRKGPVGDLFAVLQPKNIAVVGLGAGSIGCYADGKNNFTFFEIDPAVIDMAKKQFTYLDKCKGATPHRIIEGDGRLELAKLNGEKFDLIILDAFSSDMVPAHLVSVEAIGLYKQHLTENGMIAFNISNNYIQLARMLTASAQAAGMQALYKYDSPDARPFFLETQWIAMTRPDADVAEMNRRLWITPETHGQRPWTDSYSSIISVIRVD